jgi:hypothetical protein
MRIVIVFDPILMGFQLPDQAGRSIRNCTITVVHKDCLRLSPANGADIKFEALTNVEARTVTEMHTPRSVRRGGGGSSGPINGRSGIREKCGIDGLPLKRNNVVDDRIQLFDGGKPPVRITAEMCVVQGIDKVLRVRPGVSVVRIIGVIVIRGPVLAILHLPYQTGDIVPNHIPFRCGIQQGIAAVVQFGVGHRVDGVVGVLAVKWLAGRGAGDHNSGNIVAFRLPSIRHRCSKTENCRKR